MEAYKEYLWHYIQFVDGRLFVDGHNGKLSDEYIDDCITNRNEEGKLHSKYLGDRYEPALIIKDKKYGTLTHIYLFDGEIVDCTHPTIIGYYRNEIYYIRYYSSERIRIGLPIYCDGVSEFYNRYPKEDNMVKILEEYDSYSITKRWCESGFEGFSLLCDEMDLPTFRFTFAD